MRYCLSHSGLWRFLTSMKQICNVKITFSLTRNLSHTNVMLPSNITNWPRSLSLWREQLICWRAGLMSRGTLRGCRNGVMGTLREIPQGWVQSLVLGMEVSLAMPEAGKCLAGEWLCWKGAGAQQEQFSTEVCYHAFNPNKSHMLYKHFIVCFLVQAEY